MDTKVVLSECTKEVLFVLYKLYGLLSFEVDCLLGCHVR
jgi:hypothetical protein